MQLGLCLNILKLLWLSHEIKTRRLLQCIIIIIIIIIIIKERMGEIRKEENPEDLRVDGRIILEEILRKWMGRCGLDSSGSGWGNCGLLCTR
jgi:hypothetical protein